MNSSAIPIFCAVALTGMVGAGATHWWSVRQMVTLAQQRPQNPKVEPKAVEKAPAVLASAPAVVPPTVAIAAPPAVAQTIAKPAPVDKSEREFFTSLVDELKAVRQQNQELRDQVAETNRDLMELQFRVDTHSESFRPLKVTSDPGTLQNELSGVLPPRALPVE